MSKEKFMDLKKFIKEENVPGQRLQSLKLPRDLNLGGAKPARKQFVPNLNVVRNKDRVKGPIKIEPKQNIRSNGKTYKQNNSGQKFIQSSGLFSEGISSDIKKSRIAAKRSNTKENDITSNMTIPIINKSSWEFNKKREENVFDEIMGTEEDEEDEKLPFDKLIWSEKDFKSVTYTKSESKQDIKAEPREEMVSQLYTDEEKLKNSKLVTQTYHTQNGFCDDNPNITLWKLPDSFAGKSLSEESDSNDKTLADYTLSDMPEGQIGRLILRKSGLVEIDIGKIKYNLEVADFGSCREEIVAVDIDNKSGSRTVVLGEIQNRFLVNPDWDSLFKSHLL